MASTRRMMASSIQPPYQPEIRPSKVPIVPAMRIVPAATSKETRAPKSRRE